MGIKEGKIPLLLYKKGVNIMQTARGIELDLNQSKYYIDLFNYRFYFSSIFYLNKFKTNVLDFIYVENTKIKNKYGINIVMNVTLAFSYYSKIEKRGFRIKDLKTNKEINSKVMIFEKIEE